MGIRAKRSLKRKMKRIEKDGVAATWNPGSPGLTLSITGDTPQREYIPTIRELTHELKTENPNPNHPERTISINEYPNRLADADRKEQAKKKPALHLLIDILSGKNITHRNATDYVRDHLKDGTFDTCSDAISEFLKLKPKQRYRLFKQFVHSRSVPR